MNPRRLRAYIYLLTATIIWAFAGVVIKQTLKELSPAVFLTYRFFISTLIMLPFLFLQKAKKLPSTRHIFMLILASLFGTTINLGLLFYGTNLTSVNDLAVITAIAPILVVLAGAIFLKERITKQEKTGIAVTLAGTAILIGAPIIETRGDGLSGIMGNILLMLANFGWVGYALLAKKLTQEKMTSFTITFTGFLIGFITLLPLAILESGGPQHATYSIQHISLEAHAGVWYMAVFSGIVAYILYNLGQKTIEVSEGALFSYLQAIFTVPFAVILLGEKLTLLFLLGAAVVIVGIVIAEWKKKT